LSAGILLKKILSQRNALAVKSLFVKHFNMLKARWPVLECHKSALCEYTTQILDWELSFC
jgi:hypothetical protein